MSERQNINLSVFTKTPALGKGARAVWARNFLQFRYTIWVTLTWVIFEPLFYLVAIGYGLGAFVSEIDGRSYSEFFVPSLMCITATMIPFYEATYNHYSKLTYQKTYASMLLTPLSVADILWGETLWAAFKGMLGVFGVFIVALLFGSFDTWLVLPALAICFLLSLVFAALGTLFTSFAKNFDSFIYSTSGFLLPLTLFSGTYFPINDFPLWIQSAAHLFPLIHGVEAVRALTYSEWQWWHLIHLVALIVMFMLPLNWSYHRLLKRLG